jgi:hypothetical protein
MESKEVILKIYRAILNSEVEVSNVKHGSGNAIILHFEPKPNTNFAKFVNEYKNLMNKISAQEFNEFYNQYRNSKNDYKEKKIDQRKQTYILVNKANNRYKIGESINPKGRLVTLRSEEPEIEFLYSCKSSIVSEKELHNKFKEKRHIGEWFNLDFKDLNKLKKIMQIK